MKVIILRALCLVLMALALTLGTEALPLSPGLQLQRREIYPLEDLRHPFWRTPIPQGRMSSVPERHRLYSSYTLHNGAPVYDADRVDVERLQQTLRDMGRFYFYRSRIEKTKTGPVETASDAWGVMKTGSTQRPVQIGILDPEKTLLLERIKSAYIDEARFNRLVRGLKHGKPLENIPRPFKLKRWARVSSSAPIFTLPSKEIDYLEGLREALETHGMAIVHEAWSNRRILLRAVKSYGVEAFVPVAKS
ncbi:hypothetical protein BCV70DRAFT_206716 [Testicularia cyperi]|uniref:Uncharacterized protein n=1 Tax=Testicularia cyperi TaxID=1882483 RepID=A0A317XQZ6_9BASI|nr:hypothetical protein BCV70DRAFT_206716 [Testicularia cyperi]